MKSVTPSKLRKGDEIRVIAPAKSFKPSFTEERMAIAMKRFEKMGLKVSFGKHVYERNEFESTTIEHRLEDLYDAFSDNNVKGILTVLGGTHSNQLLKYIDYDLISNNPKILCGLSDITSLANAIHTKTGLVTYSGPHFTLFGANKAIDYTVDYFKQCFFKNESIDIRASEHFCNSRWDSEEIPNDGMWIINRGEAQGKVLGGNMVTFNLLQGSEYFPDISDSIVFMEDNAKESIRAFENHLQSLIHQPNFSKARGLVIGRFQEGTGMTKELLTKIVQTKKELTNLPVIANVDFGHTTPMITFPIGGECKIAAKDNPQIKITKH